MVKYNSYLLTLAVTVCCFQGRCPEILKDNNINSTGNANRKMLISASLVILFRVTLSSFIKICLSKEPVLYQP